MKHSFFLFALLLLTACTQSSIEEDSTSSEQLTQVTTTLGFTYTEDPFNTRATGVSATEAKVTRISFQVFDAQGKAYGDPILQYKGDVDFGQTSCSLPLGTYTFVAVAHAASAAEVVPATITSPSLATLPERPRSFVYSKTKTVTISNNTPTSITMDMGNPVNAGLKLQIIDKVPSGQDIKKLQIIYNAQLPDALTTFAIDPSTGLLTSDGRITLEAPLTEGDTFDNQIALLLPSNPHTATITLNALNSEDQVVVTKTATDVPFHQSYLTELTGTLFTSNVTTSFTFNTGFLDTLEASF